MANISNEFKDAVKKYVQIDNERKFLSQKSSKLKKDQDNIESFILTFMESNNMTDKNILISDGKLQYNTTSTSESLTKKYLLEKLTIFFKNEKKAEECAKFLYNSRGTREKVGLKRKKK
jgi:hypothetical protein